MSRQADSQYVTQTTAYSTTFQPSVDPCSIDSPTENLANYENDQVDEQDNRFTSEGSATAMVPTFHPTTQQTCWRVLAASIFLVSVPVFFQAPLVRLWPWLSLGFAPGLFGVGAYLLRHSKTHVFGDLLIGFAWTWLSGALYWGWLRWEPLVHIPIEAIGVPFALWGLWRNHAKIGNSFYLGSLFGTIVTDVYFYLCHLMPYWRSLMRIDPDLVPSLFQGAIAEMVTPWGSGWACALALLLIGASVLPLRSPHPHWWAFGGAVMSTLLVDGLFGLVAVLSSAGA